MIQTPKNLKFYFLSLAVLSACSNRKDALPLTVTPEPESKKAEVILQSLSVPAKVSQETIDAIHAHKLYQYPEITVSLAVKDAQKTAEAIKAAGGKVIYDPNRGKGSSIPFLIVNLPPEKITDDDFIQSLNLNAIQVDHPSVKRIKPNAYSGQTSLENVFVPTQDIGIPALRSKSSGGAMGENTIIAIIDTGVDASHPVFQNRVIYWQDMTQESNVELTKIEVKDSAITIPDLIKDNVNVYVAEINETALGGQSSDDQKTKGETGLDINQNGIRTDKFLVVAGVDPSTKETVVYVDTNGNSTLDAEEIKSPMMDFNRARSIERKGSKPPFSGFLKFNNYTKTVSFPLMLNIVDEKNNSITLSLGMDLGGHGTHVAGIAAGNGEQIQGAAPKAELMSLKVCSGLSCTDSAILRALVEAFYNPMGYTPDVVNISLGSPQTYQENIYDILMRDLSAKFGTVFVISASNAGPGYHTLNDLGSFGPAIQVGAHVSKNTLTKHYTLDPSIELPENGLLYFSSAGPSYTGQLKPNIVAPGSALSSTPLIHGGSSMYNGTSMSAPITSGAVAAVLSLSKKMPNGIEAEALRVSRAKIVREGSNSAENTVSLSSFSLAVRSALEETATFMPGYTSLQQGHGLINAATAYEKLMSLLSKNARYFDLKINANQKGKLYDRSSYIARVKEVSLSIQDDGETSESNLIKFGNTPILVELEKVEIQSTDGSVNIQTDNLPFSVAIRGVDGAQAKSTAIVLADPVKTSFYSVRNLEKMESGKTYVAIYNLSQNGIRIMTLTDVVQKPIVLSDLKKSFKVPGISTKLIESSESYVQSTVSIKANTIHRYPVAVTNLESALRVQLALSPNATGVLTVLVYDPDGKELADTAIAYAKDRVNSTPSIQELMISTLNKGAVTKEGVYEITVSTASGRWNNPTQYDLIISADRIKPSIDEIKLTAGNEDSSKTFYLMNLSGQKIKLKSEIKMEYSAPTQMVSLKPFPISANQIRLKKVLLPKNIKSKTTTAVVQYGLSNSKDAASVARIDHHLYKLDPITKLPVVAYSADKNESDHSKKVFKDVESESELYVGVEAYSPIIEGLSLDKAAKSLDIEVLFPDIELKDPSSFSIKVQDGSTDEVVIIKASSPHSFTEIPVSEASAEPKVRSILSIYPYADRPQYSIEIPITLSQ